MNPFQFTRVTTPKAAISAVTKESGTYFLAGGTNLIDLMKKRPLVCGSEPWQRTRPLPITSW